MRLKNFNVFCFEVYLFLKHILVLVLYFMCNSLIQIEFNVHYIKLYCPKENVHIVHPPLSDLGYCAYCIRLYDLMYVTRHVSGFFWISLCPIGLYVFSYISSRKILLLLHISLDCIQL